MFYNAMSIFVKKHYGRNESNVFSLFLHSAIFIRGSLAAISRVNKRAFKTKDEKKNKKSQVIIAGSQNEFAEVKKLLKNKQVIGRIETDNILNSNTIESFHNLKNVFSFCEATEIIFCEGSLLFKEIISAMPKVPGNVSIKIFSQGANAIIGSNNRNDTGEFIIKKSL
jgi:hypothetical protein